MKKPLLRIQLSEFFADPVVDFATATTPIEIRELFLWLSKNQPPIYNQAAVDQVLDRYRKRAQAERRHTKHAQLLLQRLSALASYMEKQDIHGTVYAAWLVQEAYVRLVLYGREYRHKESSRKGAETTNALRKNNENPKQARDVRIRKEFDRLKRSDKDPRNIASTLAQRHGLSSSQIRKILKKRA